ncbi:MAG: ABC transporter permease, partial [Anaerolineae bacterium]
PMRRTATIAWKEVRHIIRDWRTLIVMFLIPIVQLFLLGYAATTDVEHIRTAVLDGDRSSESRELLRAYEASGYFSLVCYVENERELAQRIDRGDVRAGLLIPAGYGRHILAGEKAQVSFVIDGSDPNIANAVFAASQQVGQAYSLRLIERRLGISPAELMALEVLTPHVVPLLAFGVLIMGAAAMRFRKRLE